eukprot:TRINITY_DN8104_c0_g1_i1.p2 TRINITY_DN8104_c0_g1~~TRINITY_DN8104_c0_g1_i1.p2  ORF type:complete len:52 (-),score=9.28 TRINITY_DN8104_c0_g1_i1:83-238(-)
MEARVGGKTALQWAMDSGRDDIVAYLNEKMATPQSTPEETTKETEHERYLM